MRRRSDLYCRPHAKSKRKFRFKQDRLSEAEVAMRRAVALDPHAYGYHFALGMVLKTRGNLREALQQLHPELDLNPELVPGREQIAARQATLQRPRPSHTHGNRKWLGTFMTRETPREDFWRRIRWKLIYYGPRREITLDVFNGLLTFDSKDWVIGRQLYVNRTYEPALIQRIPELLRQEGYLPERPRGTLVDVGANIGMTCIAMLKHGYFEKAIAFEPAPNSYRLLVHNINQNGLGGRILHYPFALSSAEGELELELSHNNSGDHRLRHSQATGNLREEKRPVLKVLVKTLDQVLADHPDLNGEDVALVWADIQGHEGQFLKGAARLLGRGIPAVCEFWPYAIGRSGLSPPDFCGIVSSLFTHFYVLHEEQLEGKQPIAGLEALFDAYTGPEGWCNLVLVRDR